MAIITRTFSPAKIEAGDTVGPVDPVGRIGIAYAPPAGHTVTGGQLLAVVVNGVNVMAHLDASASSSFDAILPKFLWQGNYRIGIAQSVTHIIPSGLEQRFASGALFDSSADWRENLPRDQDVYRRHGLSFPNATDFVSRRMDPLWSTRHKDTGVIIQLVSAMLHAADSETFRMINARNTTWIELVEPLDRVGGVVVDMNGAVGEAKISDIVDIEVLYHFPSGSRAYLYALDFIINGAGKVVFTCQDSPGRVASASTAAETPERPAGDRADGSYVFGNNFSMPSTQSVAVYPEAEAGLISGFDFFITPPRVPAVLPSDAAYPADGSDQVGKVFCHVPSTGETFMLFDPATGAGAFSGTVQFKKPIDFGADGFFRVYQIRAQGTGDTAVDICVWLSRKVVMIGPHAHRDVKRLDYFWSTAVGGEPLKAPLDNKLRLAAGMRARTEKSSQAFATYVEALLGLPLSPFEGAFVTGIRQPEASGLVPGQIDIYGAILEFDHPLDLAVELLDKVSFLQSLVTPADGVTIHDAYTDADFMAFSVNGAPPVNDPGALTYVNSKITGTVSLPQDFLDLYPGGSSVFFAAEILKSKSFRIDLGVYASQRLLADQTAATRIFQAIDAVKPSGADYWIRLSDGTAIVRSNPVSVEIDISSNLDLPTDFAQRIWTDSVFATGQYYTFQVSVPSGTPKVGDRFELFLNNGAGILNYSNVQVLVEADFAANPLYPFNALFQRWADAVNAAFTVSPSRLNADVVINRLRIRVFPSAVDFEELRYTNTLYGKVTKLSGGGTAVLAPTALTLVPANDPSTVWLTLEDATNTLSASESLGLASGANVADIWDFGSGPFDATSRLFTSGGGDETYVTTASLVTIPDPLIGRVSVEGYLYSVGGERDGRIDLNLDAGVPVAGNSVSLTVIHPTFIPSPGVTVSRVYLSSDTDPRAILLGLAKEIMEDSTLSGFFKAEYPVVDTSMDLSILPLDPDDTTNLAGFVFSLAATGWAPTLRIANRTTFSVGAAPSLSPNPTAVPVLDVSAIMGGYSSVVKQVRAPSLTRAGGAHRFSAHWQTFPVVHPGGGATGSVTFENVAGARSIRLCNARLFINDYPDYGRDPDLYAVSDNIAIGHRAGTFTYSAGAGEPPITPVPTPVPTEYYLSRVDVVDLTPRLVSPSMQLISSFVEDFALTEIYLLGGGGVRTVTQNMDPGNVPVTIPYLAGSAALYRLGGATQFIPLVLGVDYAETAPGAGTITLLTFTASIVVGFVKSPLYDYYHEGPNAVSYTEEVRVTSAFGVRALYNEALPAGPNDFRQANAANNPVNGGPIASPYGVAQYLASGVKNSKAFGTDTETISLVPEPITITEDTE